MLFKVPSKTGKPQVRLPSLCLLHLWLPGRFCVLFSAYSFVHVIPELTGYIHVHMCVWSHATLCLCLSMLTQAVASCLLMQQTMRMPFLFLAAKIQLCNMRDGSNP